jgi:putative molybdopterin biosynthesis protein
VRAATPPRFPELLELRDVSPGEAVSAWLDACRRAGRPARVGTVTVALADALGGVLAEPVWALRSSPAFAAAAMDGIAVVAADTIGACVRHPARLSPGAFDVVDTGDPLPACRDAVVIRERVRLDEAVAEIEAEASPGQHVRPVGEDIAASELLLSPGRRLRPVDLACAAAAGVNRVTVRRRVGVAILPSGNELRPAEATLAPGELVDTNSLMLDALAREAGCETWVGPILPDDPDRLSEAVVAAAAEADLVLLVAGTSAGRHDFAPEVLRRCGRIVVQGVSMRPGHPAVLGMVAGTPVMGCPGYPVSSAVAYDELARPLIEWLQGASVSCPAAVGAHLATDVRSKPGARRLVRARIGVVDGGRVAMPLRGGASVLTSLVHADALLPIAAEQEGIPAAAPIEAQLLSGRSGAEGALLIGGAPDLALELLALSFAETQAGRGRVAFCEMPGEDALALVAEGMCHVAAVSGSAGARPRGRGGLRALRLADCSVGLVGVSGRVPTTAVHELLCSGVPVAVGPHGTLARRILEDMTRGRADRARSLVEARSDAAALAMVNGGCADWAVTTVPAARRVGADVTPLGRAALDLLIHRGVGERDPLVRALLETLQSQSLAVALDRAGYETGAARSGGKRDRLFKARVVGELRRMNETDTREAVA